MRNCSLDDQGSEALADGVARNQTLVHLDLSHNRVTGESMRRWQEVLGKSHLRHFDLSFNPLRDEGAQCVIRSLLEGPVVKTADLPAKHKTAANNKATTTSHEAPGWTRKLPKLRTLLLKNVDMGDEAGLVLTQLITQNDKIQRVCIEGNILNYKYVEEVNAACAKNRQKHKRKIVPKYLEQLGHLIQST